MRTAKHLPLEKFEAIDMALDDAITPRQTARRSHSRVIPANPVDKTGEVPHMACFGAREPFIKRLDLTLFEQGHKCLAKAGRPCAVHRWLGRWTQAVAVACLSTSLVAQSSKKTLTARKDGAAPLVRRDAVWVGSPATA